MLQKAYNTKAIELNISKNKKYKIQNKFRFSLI